MSLAILVVTVAQMFDLGTFFRMVAIHGAASEANPLVAGLLVAEGVLFVAVTKVVALSFVVAAIAVLSEHRDRADHGRLAAMIAVAAIAAGLLGGWTNAATIVGRIV